MAPPFKVVDVDILYGEGISRLMELIDMATVHGLIQKAGAWYSCGDIRLGQGKDNARQYFVEHPELADEIEAKLRAIMRGPVGAAGKAGRGAAEDDAPEPAFEE